MRLSLGFELLTVIQQFNALPLVPTPTLPNFKKTLKNFQLAPPPPPPPPPPGGLPVSLVQVLFFFINPSLEWNFLPLTFHLVSLSYAHSHAT